MKKAMIAFGAGIIQIMSSTGSPQGRQTENEDNILLKNINFRSKFPTFRCVTVNSIREKGEIEEIIKTTFQGEVMKQP